MRLTILEKPVDNRGELEYKDQEKIRGLHYEVFDLSKRETVVTYLYRALAEKYVRDHGTV